MLTFGSVCSGIEAASVAWHPFGWRASWFAEVDRAASEVLAYRFPDVPNYGDMTKLAAMVRAREIPAPDVLVGGTPCQAFSVAGLRGGLSDERGQLTLAFVLLADAIDEVRAADGLDPVIVVWENVPGVLNHKDNPLGCFLGGLAGEDLPLEPPGGRWTNAGVVCGPERAIAWRTLDAQYFGLAQRRRRVFVVASARAGFDPAAVLLEFQGVRRDSPPSREAGQGVAGTLDARAAGGGFPGTDGAISGHVVSHPGRLGTGVTPDDINCMAHGQGGAEISVGDRPTLTCNHEAPIVAYANAGHFGSLKEVSAGDPLRANGGDTGHGGETIIVHGTQDPCVLAPIAFVQNSRSEVRLMGGDGQVVGALAAEAGAQQQCYIAQPVCVTGPITHTLKAEGFDASEDGTGRGQPIVPALYSIMPMNSGRDYKARKVDVAQPLMAGGPTGGNQGGDYILEPTMAVRRLMPVECERLQGFPDNWTAVPNARGKIAADGPRYKQCGNSMATNVMHWIGGRIAAALASCSDPMIGHNGGPVLDTTIHSERDNLLAALLV